MHSNERNSFVSLVRRWGGSASDAVLDNKCNVFSVNELGFVGYRKAMGVAIVYGDPICAPDQQEALVGAFDTFCRQQKMDAVYVMATDRFAQSLIDKKYAHSLLEFGEELSCDPFEALEGRGPQGRLVRKKVRRAHNEGIAVREYRGGDATLEARIEEVGERWLKGRRGPQIYIAQVSLFQDRLGKRWFYAECGGRLVGVLTLDRVEHANGWFLSHMMILADAPVGAPEILVVHVMEALRAEGCRYLSFGVVPAELLGTVKGLARFSSLAVRTLFRLSRRFFFLDGKKLFWGKFQPQSAPSYILFSKPRIGLRSLMAMTRAFNVIKEKALPAGGPAQK